MLRRREFTADVTHPSELQHGLLESLSEWLDLTVSPEAQINLAAGGTPRAKAYEAYLQGLGHLRSERFDDAVEDLETTLTLDSKFAAAHSALGDAHRGRLERAAGSEAYDKALSCYRKALDISGTFVPARVGLGQLFLDAGEPEKASEQLRSASTAWPASADVQEALAKSYTSARRLKRAEACYEEACRLRQQCTLHQLALGNFYLRHGCYDKAEPSFLRIIDLLPKRTLGYSSLAILYTYSDRLKEAAEISESQLAIEPSATLHSNLGTIYYRLGRLEEAKEEMGKGTALGDDRDIIWGNLGEVYLLLPGRAHRAPAAFERAATLVEQARIDDPNSAREPASLAVYRARLNQRDAARKAAQEALELAPDDIHVLFRVSVALELINRRDQALDSLRAALRGGYSLDEVLQSEPLKQLRKDERFSQIQQEVSDLRLKAEKTCPL